MGVGDNADHDKDLLLKAKRGIPLEWSQITGLLCLAMLLYFAIYYYLLQEPMATLFTLPLTGILLPRLATTTILGGSVCKIILAGTRVQFCSSRNPTSRLQTVFLEAASCADAEDICARLSAMYPEK